MQTVVLAALVSIFQLLIKLGSGKVRDELIEWVPKWRAKALATDNMWDDALSLALATVLGIDVSKIVPEPPEPGVKPMNMTDEQRKIIIEGPWRIYNEDPTEDPKHPYWDAP